MQAAKVQASLRIRAVSPEPSLLAHTSSESRGTFRQKARSLAPVNGWACAVKICHDGMLEDTNSLDGAHNVHSCRNVHLFLSNMLKLTLTGVSWEWEMKQCLKYRSLKVCFEKLLKYWNSHKAADLDQFKPIVLQTLHAELVPILQVIF